MELSEGGKLGTVRLVAVLRVREYSGLFAQGARGGPRWSIGSRRLGGVASPRQGLDNRTPREVMCGALRTEPEGIGKRLTALASLGSIRDAEANLTSGYKWLNCPE